VIILRRCGADLMQPFLGEIRGPPSQLLCHQRCQEIPLLPAFYGGDPASGGGAALAAEALSAKRLRPETVLIARRMQTSSQAVSASLVVLHPPFADT